MNPLRCVLVAAAFSTSCLASQPPPPVAVLSPAFVVISSPMVVATGETTPVGPLMAPMQVATNPSGIEATTPGMLRGDVYALPEHTNHLPDFRTLRPTNTLYTPEVNVPSRQFPAAFPGVTDRVEWFGVRYAGTFQIPTAGSYRFRVVSDDGARLILDGQQVLINDGTHMPTSADGAVYLTPGAHSLVLEYFQGPRFQMALQLFWSPPGQPERIFRVDA